MAPIPVVAVAHPWGRRGLVRLAALLMTGLVAWLFWGVVSTDDGRPILRPDEFVSYQELSAFVDAPLGAGFGLGSRYSYSVQTLRDGSGFVLVETIYSDDELPAAAPPPPPPVSGRGAMSVLVDGDGAVAGRATVPRPPALLSVSDTCRQIVVSGTGFDPPNDQIEWLEQLITARLADPDTVGHDVCRHGHAAHE